MFLLKFQQQFRFIKISKINHLLFKTIILEIISRIQKVKNLNKKGFKFLKTQVLFL